MKNILVFSPYAANRLHTLYEGTIARACQVRGASIHYLLCNGLLPECDQHWGTYKNSPRPFDLCRSCKQNAISHVSELGFPYEWLGDYVDSDIRQKIFAWAQNLNPTGMPGAVYDGYPIGDYVQSSVSSYFRRYPIDVTDWNTVSVFRGFLYSGAVTVAAIQNFLDIHDIDAAIVFNGRQSVTRVALELLLKNSIRVLTHERPQSQGYLNVRPNASCISLAPFAEYWKQWAEIPLTRPQLEQALNWFIERRYGINQTWQNFNTPNLSSDHSIRQAMGINADKRMVVVFTSSTDEIAAESSWQGPYAYQSEWIEDVIVWAKDRNDIDVVIRLHPNLAGSGNRGRATEEIKFYEELEPRLPDSVQIIPADTPLNSYALMEEGDVGLTYISTAGVEMAMLGKPVVLGGRTFYEHGSEILRIRSRAESHEMLNRSLRRPDAREIRRQAFRLVYRYILEAHFVFPQVSMIGWYLGELKYTHPDELRLGQSESLDRICGFLLDGEPLYTAPGELDWQRTTTDEDVFLDALSVSPEMYRNYDLERTIRRRQRIQRFADKTNNLLKRFPFGSGKILTSTGRSLYRRLFS